MFLDAARQILNDRFQSKSFYVSSPKFVEDLVDKWHVLFPGVTPHYAVKCNNNEILLRTLAKKGVNFDCASGSEIKKILKIVEDPSRIIFAHTIKCPNDILFAKEAGVNVSTFDSTYELDKMKLYHPECNMILRIRCDDPNATVQLGNKYGAQDDEVEPLLEYAMKLGIKVIGISFHVGSGSRNPDAFYKAIKAAKEAFEIAKRVGFSPKLLDVGGGFHADIDDEGELSTCISEYINDGIQDFFSDESDVKVVAEPGRFFAEHYSCLVTRVVGKRERDGLYEYFLNDSTYGGFSNVIFEKATPVPTVIRTIPDDEEYHTSVIYGCTCDGVDVINPHVQLPELHVDDWILFEHWGAYTQVLHTGFNGFGQYDTYYI
jgi:ornithine decarboxylase